MLRAQQLLNDGIVNINAATDIKQNNHTLSKGVFFLNKACRADKKQIDST